MTYLFDPAALPILTRRDGQEIILDSFAGGGGASTGIFLGLGRHPDVAINHSAEAVAMHKANHPTTRHHCQSIWQVDPSEVAASGPIGLAWFSPDCKHFSKAKGGKPVEKSIRDLAWIVVAYARLPRTVRPRIICLENVEEFTTWGRLTAEGHPDPEHRGEEFQRWVAELRRLDYKVDWRELRACDYGAPTIRKRLFLIARCDGEPIRWPEPTHGAPTSDGVRTGRLKPWRTAAEIIDWTIPCPSIFLTPEEARTLGVRRPLQEATMRRIAQGLRRYVLNSPRPFIVPLTHSGDDRSHDSLEPLRTITTAKRGELALAMPYMTRFHGRSTGSAACAPAPTIETRSTDGLVAAWMIQQNTGLVGHAMTEPVSTVLSMGSTQMLAAARLMCSAQKPWQGSELPGHPAGGAGHGLAAGFLAQLHGSNAGNGGDPHEPLGAVLAQGNHHAAVRALLERTAPAGAASSATVSVDGSEWTVADVGMRMLTPRELFKAQGFPDDYIIDVLFEGRHLSKASQVRLCGNSVCPDVAAALVAANATELIRQPLAA